MAGPGGPTLSRLACIVYPGIVHDDNKALATLGGKENVSMAIGHLSRRLELRYRPGDIYSKSACASRTDTTHFLLRVRRLRKKSNPQETRLVTDILGTVPQTFQFTSLMDYQYLPMSRRTSTATEKPSYDSLIDTVSIRRLVSSEWLDNPNAPLFSIPLVFSRMDNPVPYLYRKEQPAYASAPLHVVPSGRKRRFNFNQLLTFESTEVPKKPSKAASLSYLSRISSQELEHVRECFKTRPVWTRSALLAETGLKAARLQLALPLVAYYFTTGPWRQTWVRYGYDPRTDPSAKQYQLLEFRIKDKYGMPSAADGIPVKKRAQPFESLRIRRLQHSLHSLADNRVASPTADASEWGGAAQKGNASKKASSYIFQPNVKPPFRHMSYQLCDVHIPEVQAMLEDNNGQLTTCDKLQGWCEPEFAQKCRRVMLSYLLTMGSDNEGDTLEPDTYDGEAEEAASDEEDLDDPEYIP